MTGFSPYPTGLQFAEAIQNPQIAFRNGMLASGTVVLNKLGLPKAISGNFASVFQVRTGVKLYAVKCFTTDVPQRDSRYAAVHNYLGKVHAGWKVDFDYRPDGILVAGTHYPLLAMEWVSGQTLIPWLDRNVADRGAVRSMADSFAAIVTDLQSHGVAHGDLQHENLLVDSTGQLRLIDYDGMYIPSIRHLGAAERGHRNYQHPDRNLEFDNSLDNFASWVLYASLIILALEPSYWRSMRTPGDDKLLFDKTDYTDPRRSGALARLRSGSADVRRIERTLTELFAMDLADVPPLATQELFASSAGGWWRRSSAPIASPRSANVPQTERWWLDSAADGQGLPDWVRDHKGTEGGGTASPRTPPSGQQRKRSTSRRHTLYITLLLALIVGMSSVPLWGHISREATGGSGMNPDAQSSYGSGRDEPSMGEATATDIIGGGRSEDSGSATFPSTAFGAVLVGDCLDVDSSGHIGVPHGECADGLIVAGRVALDEEEYPGESAIASIAEGHCHSLVAKFLGVVPRDVGLSTAYYAVSEEEWSASDGSVVCLVSAPGSMPGPVPISSTPAVLRHHPTAGTCVGSDGAMVPCESSHRYESMGVVITPDIPSLESVYKRCHLRAAVYLQRPVLAAPSTTAVGTVTEEGEALVCALAPGTGETRLGSLRASPAYSEMGLLPQIDSGEPACGRTSELEISPGQFQIDLVDCDSPHDVEWFAIADSNAGCRSYSPAISRVLRDVPGSDVISTLSGGATHPVGCAVAFTDLVSGWRMEECWPIGCL